jgi:hypothetical protein
LLKNAESFENWRCFEFGIGDQNALLPLYFVNGKSGQGSLFRANALQGLLSKTDGSQSPD